MYFDYLKERDGVLHLINEDGFITYKIYPTIKQLFVSDIYVKPESRKKKTAKNFFLELEKIAKEHSCDHIGCTTDMNTNGWDIASSALIGDGFEVVNCDDEGIIYFSKGL